MDNAKKTSGLNKTTVAIVKLIKTGVSANGASYALASVLDINAKTEPRFHDVAGFGFNGELLKRNGTGKLLMMSTKPAADGKFEVITFARETSLSVPLEKP